MKAPALLVPRKSGKEGLKRKVLTSGNADPLSACSRSYAIAAVNPWGVTDPPCVPDLLNVPSYKFAAQSKGIFTVGTSGFGYCGYNPYGQIQNTEVSLWNTTATFSGVTTQWTGVGSAFTSSDSPYPSSAFLQGTGVQNQLSSYRVVGSAMRVRYVGSEVSRAGQLVIYRDPLNQPMGNGISTANMLANRETVSAVVDREWRSVVWKPADPTDVTYFDTFNVAVGNYVGRFHSVGSGSLLIAITGGTPGTSFEYEAITWYELIGAANPQTTPSHSDIVGMSAVNSARGVSQMSGSLVQDTKTFIGNVYDALTHASGFIHPGAPKLLGFVKSLANSALGSSGSNSYTGSSISGGYW